MAYTLQLLHVNDLEGNLSAVGNEDGGEKRAANLATLVDHFETNNGYNSILISAGDNYIPGPFYAGSEVESMGAALTRAFERAVTELDDGTLEELGFTFDIEPGRGRADIAIMNILGFDATVVGNHEFDAGAEAFADLINFQTGGESDGNTLVNWTGALFPYLSANLDFSDDAFLGPLVETELDLPARSDFEFFDGDETGDKPAIASAAVINRGGEQIGVVGATTQIVTSLSSTGGVKDSTGGKNDMAALAAVLQPEIDAMIDQGINKIVVVSHLQQIVLEKELATLLNGVDIIVSGGSHTLQADETDMLRDGDTAAETYPFLTQNADGNDVAVLSMDGQYSYLGRLVVEFDDAGNLVSDSIDTDVSGAYATNDETLVAVTGATSAKEAIDNSIKGDIVRELTDALNTAITDSADSIIYGEHDVYLDGRRGTVRTEESNLGNLTADANLATARFADDSVMVSFKNGGGIRAPIGEETDQGLTEGDGQISLLDVQNTLAFDNNLTLVTLDLAGFKMILEHAVAATDTAAGVTAGQFLQIGGFRVSFDEQGDAQVLSATDDGDYIVDEATGMPQVDTAGTRIQTVALIDPETGEDIVIIRDGQPVEGAPSEIRMVALDFLVSSNGDGYPFQELGRDVQYITAGGAATSDENAQRIGEQKALSDYISANFADDAFAMAETDVTNDRRIVQLDRNGGLDLILLDENEPTLEITKQADLLSGETELFTGGAEVIAYEDGLAVVTNGAQTAVDVFDAETGEKVGGFSATEFLPIAESIQSVAVKNGIVAAAVSGSDGKGYVIAGIPATEEQIVLEVGNLPDMLTFTPDGAQLLVANEGEPNDDGDPMGSISIIDVVTREVVTLDFTGFDDQAEALFDAGVLLERDEDGNLKAPSVDLEPEYIAVMPDGKTAWVSLQEANAYAVVDLESASITDIRSFGVVDRSLTENALDASNRDNAINLQTYDNLFGMRQPDAITAIEIDGETYVLSANEGDARDDTEDRVKDLDLDVAAFTRDLEIDPESDLTEQEQREAHVAMLQRDENLGRLNVRTDLGDTDGDGDYDELYHYGSRSFTIYDAQGAIIFDSANMFSRLIAEIRPDLFNGDDDEFDNRSDDKGVEPEAIAAGKVGDRTFAFIGLERDNGIMVFDISDPTTPIFDQYIDSRQNGNISPETIQFISADESTTGAAQIAVAYEGDGNSVIYNLGDLMEPAEPTEPETVTLGEDQKNEIIAASPDLLDGVSYVNFDADDSFTFDGNRASGVSFDSASGLLSFGPSMVNVGQQAGLTALALASGAAVTTTTVKFVTEDQTLREGVRIDDAAINGIVDQTFLTGTGISDIVMTLDSSKTKAKFDNIIGIYEVDKNGSIMDVQIAFASTKARDGSFTLSNADIDEGAQLGFFMIQNGANTLGDISADTLEFVDMSGEAGMISDGANLMLSVNGSTIDAEIFHSLGAEMNSDGVAHVLSGAVDAQTLQLGFEDLIGGDNDYQDTVLTVMHDYV